MENSALTGTDGYVIYQQGNGGEEIPGTLTGSQEAVNGSDVALTLDHDVDWYVKQALLEGQKEDRRRGPWRWSRTSRPARYWPWRTPTNTRRAATRPS